MAAGAAPTTGTAASGPSSPEDQEAADRPPDESVHYLWREGRGDGADADADDAAARPATTPDHPISRASIDFDPWRIEAERERERRETSRRAALTRRGSLRLLLWLHLPLSALACASGATAVLLAAGRLLRLATPSSSGSSSPSLECYASSNPRTNLSVCQVSVGLGCVSAIAWPLLYVSLFLGEAALPGMPPFGTVRPRYGQLSFAAVVGLAWGATAAGALAQRSGADAAGLPFAGVRLALGATAALSAVLFLLLAAADVALVFLLSVEYAAGTLQGDNGGIFAVMFGGGEEEEEAVAAVAAGEQAVAGERQQQQQEQHPQPPVLVVDKAPWGVAPLLAMIAWAPPVPPSVAGGPRRRRQRRRSSSSTAAFELC